MLFKNSMLSAASNATQSISLKATARSSTSSPRSTRHPACWPYDARQYAAAAADPREYKDDKERDATSHVWPQSPKGADCPTPYQIFDLKHNQQYTKARFYQLVKFYHPDLDNGSKSSSSHSARVERHRLLVAAHTILSDPVKRSAYDRFGAGWGGKAEVGAQERWPTSSSNQSPGPFSHSWNESGDPIWQNATWEDWERWRERRSGVQEERRAPLYMKNTYFLAMVVALAMMGGSMNYNRAQDAGTFFIEQRDVVHDRAAKDLRRVRQEKQPVSERQGRIDLFVQQREATLGTAGFDVEALHEKRANRLLKNEEICRSDDLSRKE